jgi:hypothetical protein
MKQTKPAQAMVLRSLSPVLGGHSGARVTAELELLIRGLIQREDALGWESVRRVPSTYTWKIVDYLRSLDRQHRLRLFEAFVANSLFFFDPSRDPALHAAKAGHPEYESLMQSLPLMSGWQYADVRSLRAILGDQLGKRPSLAFANTPVEVLQRAQAIRPTKATEIRKTVRQMFGERFGSRPESLGGGDWRYVGTHRGRPFVVSIDYGGWDQLRYSVDYADPQSGMQVCRLSYERLVGAGHGHWDALTADNLEGAIRLLCELVEKLVELPDALEGSGAA